MGPTLTWRRDRRGRIWWTPRPPTAAERVEMAMVKFAEGMMRNPRPPNPILAWLRQEGEVTKF